MTDLTPEQIHARELLRQIEADIALAKVQARWEPINAIAALALGIAAMTGAIVGLANWQTHRPQPAQVVILKDAR